MSQPLTKFIYEILHPSDSKVVYPSFDDLVYPSKRLSVGPVSDTHLSPEQFRQLILDEAARTMTGMACGVDGCGTSEQ